MVDDLLHAELRTNGEVLAIYCVAPSLLHKVSVALGGTLEQHLGLRRASGQLARGRVETIARNGHSRNRGAVRD